MGTVDPEFNFEMVLFICTSHYCFLVHYSIAPKLVYRHGRPSKCQPLYCCQSFSNDERVLLHDAQSLMHCVRTGSL